MEMVGWVSERRVEACKDLDDGEQEVTRAKQRLRYYPKSSPNTLFSFLSLLKIA